MKDNINILVVDDDPIIIMSSERVLKAEGYNMEGAHSAKEAMHRIEHNNYDLVLTDLNMLELGGLALIKWLKQFRPSIGIVVITASLLQETIKEALQLGINEHMMKLSIPAVLRDAINRTIEWTRGNALENEQEKEFPPAMLAELDKVINQYRKKPNSAIPVLLCAQEIFGYLPPKIQQRIAQGLNIYPSEICSIVSFYSCFRTKPKAEHTIRVCRGATCYMKGSEGVLGGVRETLKIDVGDTTRNRKFTLKDFRCVASLPDMHMKTHRRLRQGALLGSGKGEVINRPHVKYCGLNERKMKEIIREHVTGGNPE
ncbi:MAG: NAD(P)H-dependent oxidoreductase subunit E [Planctomycetota bacterium]